MRGGVRQLKSCSSILDWGNGPYGRTNRRGVFRHIRGHRVDDNPEHRRSLAQNLVFAGNLGAQIIRAKGKHAAAEVAKLVHEKHITEVGFRRSAQGWRRYLYLSAVQKFLRDAPPIDVHILTQEMK
jgi:two-component system sensor histidine kinase KdpD